MHVWVWIVIAALAAIVFLVLIVWGKVAWEPEPSRDDVDIRPLPPESRSRYVRRWVATQTRFVDDPQSARAEADELLREVLEQLGFPPDEFELYRAPSGDPRQAVRHYRAVFAELLAAGDIGKAGDDDEDGDVELRKVVRLR